MVELHVVAVATQVRFLGGALFYMTRVVSSVVRIPAFQAGGPGSIPGRRILQDVPVAKWIRRRFPEPKIVGSSPIWDGAGLWSSGMILL